MGVNYLKKGRLRSYKLCGTSGPDALYQVGTGKQGIKAIQVLGNSTVYYLRISELPLDDEERILDAFIRQIEPVLNQIHPQHQFDSSRRTSSLPCRIDWHDQGNPSLPWYDGIHLLQKLFLLCDSLSMAVFHIAECHLRHAVSPDYPRICTLLLYHTICGLSCLRTY